MSYALETKKRKFHRVLESITKPSTPDQTTKLSATSSTANTPATARPLTAREAIKKARLTETNTPELTSARNSVLKVARPGTQASTVPSTARPSFVPWDRERFLERLETFRRVDRWSPKPGDVSEVVWAKRGWVCSDVERVSCVGGCGGSVVVKLPDELDELDGYDMEKVQERREVRGKLVEEYTKLLVEGHGENCPWKNKGCDATIHRLPLANPDTAISCLQKRYLNLVGMEDRLPSNDHIQTPESLNVDEIIDTLPEGFSEPNKPEPHPESQQGTRQETQSENQPNPEDSTNESQGPVPRHQETPQRKPPINRAALALALFGWDIVSDGAAGLSGCAACFRRLGLWMYKPKDNGETRVYDALEPVTEHMEYCPWINGTAQSGTGKSTDKPETLRSGWEALVQALKIRHRRRVRSVASMGSLRAGSEAPSSVNGDGPVLHDGSDGEARKATDREWWSKIRRMRQVLNVKSPRRKSVASGDN